MYTNNIILEEVSAAEFERMKQYWSREKLKVEDDFMTSRIIEPLMWPLVSRNKEQDYLSFLDFLLGHPYLSQISVVEEKGWSRYKPRELKGESLERIASHAAADPRKRHYFEVKFSTREGFYVTVQKATIEFAELCFGAEDCRIVGFQVIVPSIYRNWFTIAGEAREYELNHGLWVPEKGMKVRVNAG